MRAAIWFPHETGASGDLKIQGLVQKYGLEGYGRWWVLVEKLASEENYVLMRRPYVISALAGLMRCEPSDVEAFVDDCINQFELLKTDGEAIWSDALLRRMEAREEKLRARSEAARKAAKQRWDGRETSEGEAQRMRTQSDRSSTAVRPQCDSMHRTGEERTGEKRTGRKHKGRFQASARASKAMENFFVQYKTSTGKEHPSISQSEKANILEGLDRIFASFEDVIDADPELSLQATIKQFFKDWKAGDLKAENPTIWLFLTPEVWRMRAFRAGVIDTEDVFDRADGSVLGEGGK